VSEFPDERDLSVISTNRADNTAYVAYCGLHRFGTACRHWTNNVVALSLIERLMGCKFEDGNHPHVSIKISEEVDIYNES
jgi:hypothetical protein